jgi:hypothetical protein
LIRKIIAALAALFAPTAFGQLQSWPDWVATAPYIAKQVPPSAMVMRGIGTNEYYVLEVDPATGSIPVNATVSLSINYSGDTGDPVPSEAAYIGGIDPNGDLQGVAVDVSGRLQVDGTSDNDFAGPTGSPAPSEAGYVAGVDGNGDLKGLAVDATGQLLVDVVASALPSGAATSANQTSAINLLTTIESNQDTQTALLTTIDTDTGLIQGSVDSIDTKTPSLGQKNMAGSVPVVIASDQLAVDVHVTTADVDIRDLSYITDSVTAYQDGAWDINNISGTVSLPTGAATELSQFDMITELQEIKDLVSYGTYLEVKDKINLNYSSTNVTTSAYVEIISSAAGLITGITAFDSSGQGMILALGSVSSEVDFLYIPPGGFDGQVSVSIPSGERISIKAINGTANAGRFIANFMGPK